MLNLIVSLRLEEKDSFWLCWLQKHAGTRTEPADGLNNWFCWRSNPEQK